MPKKQKTITEYRHYDLPVSFPLLLLSGDKWHISDVKSDRLHFHNCMEIGICLSQTGYMEFEGVPVPFKAGDISCVPQNLPHTTYSSPGEASLWTYIHFNPDEMFRDMFPGNAALISGLSMVNTPNIRYIYNKEEFPKLYFLASAIVDELENKPDNYQISVRALMFALCMEIRRYNEPFISGDTPPSARFGG